MHEIGTMAIIKPPAPKMLNCTIRTILVIATSHVLKFIPARVASTLENASRRLLFGILNY